MNTAGIVAEYNPFHNGHMQHIAETKKMLSGCPVVCVMSGNFTQRGDFALLPKHARAQAAVRCGADLVLELPLPWCLASAERFAFGAVSLLDALGIVTHLSFGSECGSVDALESLACHLDDPGFSTALHDALSDGRSFPAARQTALGMLCPDAALLSGPNNILGLEYIKALRALRSDIKPVTVRRQGSGHDTAQTENDFASASLLRSLAKTAPDKLQQYMPAPSFDVFMRECRAGAAPVFSADADASVMAVLRKLRIDDYQTLPDMSEGFHNRLFRAVAASASPQEAAAAAKTKRYTLSRIRRQLLCAYLGVSAGAGGRRPPYARVLAFNDAGRALLRAASQRARIPILTKPASVSALSARCNKLFALECEADDLYMLACPSPALRRAGFGMRSTPFYLSR